MRPNHDDQPFFRKYEQATARLPVRDQSQAAQPNEAHRSIAQLQSRFNVLNITQNIDDLLERAGCERA